MQIVIEIPTEFEEHFKSDRFEDSLTRIASDIESFGFYLAGRYEKETITMLRMAFKNGTPLPKGHGRLIDADAIKYNYFMYPETDNPTKIAVSKDKIDAMPPIIEADGGEEDADSD